MFTNIGIIHKDFSRDIHNFLNYEYVNCPKLGLKKKKINYACYLMGCLIGNHIIMLTVPVQIST